MAASPPTEAGSEEVSPSVLLPGLPDDLAVLCIARIPSTACIWGVSRAWRRLLLSSALFHHLRRKAGLQPHQWLYALLKPPTGSAFQWHAYDPLACAWRALPPLPIAPSIEFALSSPALIGHSYSVQCAASATRLFMVAACRLGEGSNPQVPPLSRDWSRQQAPRPPPAAAAQDRRSIEPALPSPLVFNTLSNSWSFSPPLLYGPRCWCATGVDDTGKLYVAGGCGKLWDVHVSKCAECYDPDHNTWTPIQGLPSSKFSGEAISIVNYEDKLHMVSGRGVFRKAGTLYDPCIGKWLDMPCGMRTGWTDSCFVLDGSLISLNSSIGRLQMYHSASDTWHYLLENTMLKGLEQPIAAPRGHLCGLIRCPSGNGNFIRVIRISPSLVEINADVDRQLNHIDISAPFPKSTIVALQLLSSIVESLFPC